MKIEDVDNKTAAELLADSGLFGAICIDTNVYDGLQGSFERGLLKSLEQFAQGYPVNLLMPEVIWEETRGHLIERADAAARDLKKAMRAVGSGLGFSREDQAATMAQALNGQKPADIAESRLRNFIAATGTTIVSPTGLVDIAELQRRYFEAVPPFAATGDKKSEFPDAIALLSLEGWAQRNNKHVLLVSHDGDWVKFCDESRWLHVIGDLGHAIGLFQHAAAANRFAERIGLWMEKSPESARLKNHIADDLWSFSVSIDANSEYAFEDDLVDISLKEVHLPEAEGVVVSANEDYWVIEVSLRVEVDLEVDFSFSVRDGIDKDFVQIGSAREHESTAIELSVVLSFIPPDDDGDSFPELDDIEIFSRKGITVDFGYVSPRFDDYEE